LKKRAAPGPDPAFPRLSERERFRFPDPEANDDGLVAVGGNLSPGMLLSAYEQGIFPWFGPDDPVLWFSPDPRFVLFPGKLHVSESMRKVLRRGDFTVRFDHDFRAVISSCAEIGRPGQPGTWITGDMIEAYTELYRGGYAHSAESYDEQGALVGGCYGIRLTGDAGGVFFGESMFAKRANASKAAFLTLARALFADGVVCIDCQVPSDHLRTLGAEEIRRRDFLALLRAQNYSKLL
jgi:leucyl/phenylalanyl-tRNA--protein transferase